MYTGAIFDNAACEGMVWLSISVPCFMFHCLICGSGFPGKSRYIITILIRQDNHCDGHVPDLAQVTKEEVVQNLRRQSKGYQKTSSQFRGVTRHQKGKWEARIGQMVGKKYKCALGASYAA